MLPLLTLLFAPAPAATSAAAADARCAAVFSYLAANQPDQAANARSGVLYFTGRLQGRDPRINLTEALRVAGDAISHDPTAELPRCRAEAQAAVRALAIAGRSIAGGK